LIFELMKIRWGKIEKDEPDDFKKIQSVRPGAVRPGVENNIGQTRGGQTGITV
jgi:hypothetical protein